MDDLNTAHVMQQPWEKLPMHLRSKWTEGNNKTKSANGRIADFEEFLFANKPSLPQILCS